MVMWVIVWGFGTVRDNKDMFNYDGDVGDSPECGSADCSAGNTFQLIKCYGWTDSFQQSE